MTSVLFKFLQIALQQEQKAHFQKNEESAESELPEGAEPGQRLHGKVSECIVSSKTHSLYACQVWH